jgi:hypothetical protein
VDTVHGPNPIQKTGTVSVPRDLLREIGIDPAEGGHHAHWMLNPDIPGTLVLIPARLVARAQPGLVDALRDVAQ